MTWKPVFVVDVVYATVEVRTVLKALIMDVMLELRNRLYGTYLTTSTNSKVVST